MPSSGDIQINTVILEIVDKQFKNQNINQTFHAACSECKNKQILELCFDCRQPLCLKCTENHFMAWKDRVNKKLYEYEQDLTQNKDFDGKKANFINKKEINQKIIKFKKILNKILKQRK